MNASTNSKIKQWGERGRGNRVPSVLPWMKKPLPYLGQKWCEVSRNYRERGRERERKIEIEIGRETSAFCTWSTVALSRELRFAWGLWGRPSRVVSPIKFIAKLYCLTPNNSNNNSANLQQKLQSLFIYFALLLILLVAKGKQQKPE